MPNRLTPRFEDALLYANRLHATQTRKGSGVPYVSHLLAVASLGAIVKSGV
jgi:(p)ppGpp synthase/HD superfamily hydrolase